MKTILQKVTLLKYVQNKDVFMNYHKAHLTRRLILEMSNDQEMEDLFAHSDNTALLGWKAEEVV